MTSGGSPAINLCALTYRHTQEIPFGPSEVVEVGTTVVVDEYIEVDSTALEHALNVMKGVAHGLTSADSRGREGEYFPKAHGAGVQLG